MCIRDRYNVDTNDFEVRAGNIVSTASDLVTGIEYVNFDLDGGYVDGRLNRITLGGTTIDPNTTSSIPSNFETSFGSTV